MASLVILVSAVLVLSYKHTQREREREREIWMKAMLRQPSPMHVNAGAPCCGQLVPISAVFSNIVHILIDCYQYAAIC